ncbi:MAG: BamA/TamA family outer membrane protein, partial [Bacteroidota bacterium]
AYNLPNPDNLEHRIRKKEARQARKNKKRKARGKPPKERGLTTGEWLRQVVGEPPAVLDTSLTARTSRQLALYIRNKGYFNSEVSDSTDYLPHRKSRKKRARVHYFLAPSQPYRIRKTARSIADTAIERTMSDAISSTLIRPGANFDVDLFQRERERITREMKQQGYYYFVKEYVSYDVDSALSSHQVDVVIKVSNHFYRLPMPGGKDTLVETPHRQYTINRIYINPGYYPRDTLGIPLDTLTVGDYQFLYRGRLQFKPDVLLSAISIKKGALYNIETEQYSFRRLSALKTFKFINIDYQESEDGTPNGLDCFINLTPALKQSVSIEYEGTNRSGNLGMATSVTYRNKNTFRGAEILDVTFSGGLEAQQSTNNTDERDPLPFLENTPFNTLELGAEVTLNTPKLTLIGKLPWFRRVNEPRSSANLAYNFQSRPDYTRNLLNASVAYHIQGNKFTSYTFLPVELSLIQIDNSDSFQQSLNETNNSSLINSYNDHFIAASRFSFIYTNQNSEKSRNFVYFRANVETAGQALRGIMQLAGAEEVTDSIGTGFNVLGIRFAQYIRTDFDFRKYNIIDKGSQLVYRGFFGIGIPRGNLDVLPFEKSFFGGGANGIRAWQARTLGPGSFSDSTNSGLDRVGDIHFEANLEYRFKLTKVVEGAAFVDVGNIWLIRDDDSRTGGSFDPGEFISELAIGPGLGTRLNFNFFIIRLDLAMQVKDPSFPKGQRWFFQEKDGPYSTQFTFNLAIDYPF